MSFNIKEHAPLIAFIGFSLRLIGFGAGIGEAIALFALAGLLGGKMYMDSRKETPINDQVKADLAEMKHQISAMNSANQLSKTTVSSRRF
jgi:hypothetical protein